MARHPLHTLQLCGAAIVPSAIVSRVDALQESEVIGSA
jgi:hypothetical protein